MTRSDNRTGTLPRPIETAAPDLAGAAISVSTLRKRGDFLAAASGLRRATPGFVLQARARGDGEALRRVGLTCSRRVGNAVARNRAKRRLRALARAVIPALGQPGWDYVLIGRAETTATLPMDQLTRDLQGALAALHGDGS